MHLVKVFGLLLAMMARALAAAAAPGDILLSSDFEGPCTGLGADWSTTSTNLGGVSTQTSNSGTCAMFTRGGVVTNTSRVVNLGAVTGADLDVWIRQGTDAYSEDTDPGEDLIVEYLNASALWVEIDSFAGAVRPVGAVFTINIALPSDAIHSGFRLRFRQTGGNGGPPANNNIGWDYWHIDDVIITETGTAPPPPPSSNLAANTCDDFENGFGNWDTTEASASDINTDTANSGLRSLFLRHQTVTTTTLPFNSGGVNEVTVWVRRGADTFSENPEGGENLVFQYRNSSNVWVTLETFSGSGTQGQIFNRTYALPAAAQHANFQVRFTLVSASGVDFDYWHVDDVCFNGAGPDFAVTKTVDVEQDPINGTVNPLNIPGAWATYSITVTNNGAGSVDAGSMSIGDVIDDQTVLFTGDFDGAGSPFEFVDGTGVDASGLSLIYAGPGSATDGVTFLDALNASIAPNGGFDPAVERFELTFNGAMNGTGGGGNPTFTIRYRVLIE